MIGRSCVAFLISTLAVGLVAASAAGWLGNVELYHNWGAPLSAEAMQQEIQGVWAETPTEVPGETTRFAAWIVTQDRLTWYTFVTFDGRVSDVEEARYSITCEPNTVPHRFKLTPDEAASGGSYYCVYTIDGETMKLWSAMRDYPHPTTRTLPQVQMFKNKLPEEPMPDDR